MDCRNRVEEWTVASRIEPWDVLVPVHSRQKCPFSKSGNVKKNYYLGTRRAKGTINKLSLEPRGLSGGSLAALGKAPQINAAEVGKVCCCAGNEEV